MNPDATKHDQQATEPAFVAELSAHRSLGRNGFILLMIFVALTCLISGLMFLVAGAWPVFIFMGLDVLIVYVAFKINYRDGRARERVSVAKDELRIEKIDPYGKIKEHVFNPLWTRFDVDRHDEYGITRMWITSKGINLTIGSFLNPDDRESFALAFNRALLAVKS